MDLTTSSLSSLPKTVVQDVRDLFRVSTWKGLFSGKGSIFDMGERYPLVRRDGSSSLEGVYLAGNVAGNPDIKAALNTGVTAAQAIARRVEKLGPAQEGPAVVIVGGGPAGVAAALELEKLKISYVVLERRQLFQTLRSFKPELELYYAKTGERGVRSPLEFKDALTKETLASWEQYLSVNPIHVETNVEIERVFRQGGELKVVAKGGREWRPRAVLLAVGKLVFLDKLAVRDTVGHEPSPEERIAGNPGAPAVGKENVEKTAFDPAGILRGTPLRYERDFTLQRTLFLIGWALFITWLYLAKSGLLASQPGIVGTIFGDPLSAATRWLRHPAEGTDQVDLAGKWQAALTIGRWNGLWLYVRDLSLGGCYSLVYSVVVLIFGIRAARRWNDSIQRKKYALLIFTQCFFYFALPELILRPVMESSWFAYTLAYPWPLVVSPKTLQYYYSPGGLPANLGDFLRSGNFYLLWAAFISFVLLPLGVLFQGKKFCSWMCGCGGLAETLGDEWRQFRPAGVENRHRERQIYYCLAIVAIVSVVHGIATVYGERGSGLDRLGHTLSFLYTVFFDLLAVSIIPVVLYPVLGGKVWCRYWCPTAGFMHLLSALFRRKDKSRYAIIPKKERCIACDFCTRYCEVGIDVRSFALKGKVLDNLNSSCIGCGLCITVCPTDVLRFDDPRGLVQLVAKKKP